MSQPADLFETKSDYAYRQVRDRILSGELQPGAVIQQRDLASLIGISTTPLREALRRLKSEGLVELDAHRDARISPLRAEEARDLLELRKSLDPLAAGLAAQRRTKADIQAIRTALPMWSPLPTPPEIGQLVAHRNFHAAIYRASHNDLLIGRLGRAVGQGRPIPAPGTTNRTDTGCPRPKGQRAPVAGRLNRRGRQRRSGQRHACPYRHKSGRRRSLAAGPRDRRRVAAL